MGCNEKKGTSSLKGEDCYTISYPTLFVEQRWKVLYQERLRTQGFADI